MMVMGTVVHQGSVLREETTINAWWVVRVGHVFTKQRFRAETVSQGNVEGRGTDVG